MFQFRSGEIDEFWWWDSEIISADAGSQLTSKEFKEECQTRGVHLTLAAMEHQEMNWQVEVTRRIAHSLMLHARILEV